MPRGGQNDGSHEGRSNGDDGAHQWGPAPFAAAEGGRPQGGEGMTALESLACVRRRAAASQAAPPPPPPPLPPLFALRPSAPQVLCDTFHLDFMGTAPVAYPFNAGLCGHA